MTENEMSDEQEDIVAKAEALLALIDSIPPDEDFEQITKEEMMIEAAYWWAEYGKKEDWDFGSKEAREAAKVYMKQGLDLIRNLLAEVKRLRGELGVQE